jgi:hypothetical protein
VATPILITSKEMENKMNKVFAVAEQYEGIYTTLGVFTTKELAQQALDKYLAEFENLTFLDLMAKGMYIEELELHA